VPERSRYYAAMVVPTINIDYLQFGVCFLSPVLFVALYNRYKDPNVNRKVFASIEGLQSFKKWYNYIISALSLVIFVITSVHFVVYLKHTSIPTLMSYYHVRDAHELPTSNLYAFAWMLFFVLKYVEWADTLFMLIDGKRVTWLQYVHHAITPSIAASTFGQPFATPGPILNTLCHTLMYAYYNHSRALRKQKILLTILQIIQHVYMSVECMIWAFQPFLPLSYGPFYWNSYLGCAFSNFGYCFFLTFFINFFIQTYVVKKKPSNKKDIGNKKS